MTDGPIRVVLVEDNQVFREALELLLGLRDDIDVVASVADGSMAVPACLEHKPDVVVMDYRLPGLDGVQATQAVVANCPGTKVVVLTASANLREMKALEEAGAVACLTKDEDLDEIVGAILNAAGLPVNLTTENTAIVVDSTADFPEAAERFRNWRMVPLYVRFGDDVYRDYVELGPREFYERLRSSPTTPATSQPTPGDFAATYAELAGYERIFSIHIPESLSGTIQSARVAAEELGDKVRTIDSGTASAAIAMLGFAVQRRLERGTTDEEVDALVARFKENAGLLFTVDTLEFLQRGGRIGRAAKFAGQLLHVKPILTIENGEVVPLKRVRGAAKAFAEFQRQFTDSTIDTERLRVGIAHAEAPARAEQLRKMVAGERPHAQVEIVTTLGAVVGTHAGPGTVGFFWFMDDV